jgi:hypothetical protein
MNTKSASALSSMVYDNRAIFFLLAMIIAFLILDTLLIKIYPFTTTQAVLESRLVIFAIIGAVYAIGQFLILKFIKEKSRKVQSKEQLRLDKIHALVTITQFAITAILVIVILQMVSVSRYSNGMIIATTTMSYGLSIFLMGTLAERFFLWYSSNKSIVVVFYAISSTLIAANAILTLVLVDIILLQQPPEVRPHSGPVAPTSSLFLASISLTGVLNLAYVVTTVASYVSFWFSTALLLYHYSEKLGKTKYWVSLSIPLLFFISQFMPFFVDLFSSFRQSEPILFSLIYTLIFTLSKPVGGILFGIAFWIVARSLPRKSIVRDYFILSAFGIVLLFTSNQAIILVSFTYPPFGLATVSFLGISSYLILVGIYSSAISVSQDVSLRRSIRNHALKEVKLLDSIGTAQVQQEIEKKVITFTRKTRDSMVEETGITPSLDDADIRKYIEDVISEVRKKQT